jgi:hypothetical protein
MAITRILKQDTVLFKDLTELFEFLNKKQIKLHQTVYNGIIFQSKCGKYFKYSIEGGDFAENLPPDMDGNFIECDEMGHIDFYQE